MSAESIHVTCGVCGGEGMGTIRTASAEWTAPESVVHSDPAVCRDELARQRRELERRLAATPSQEHAAARCASLPKEIA